MTAFRGTVCHVLVKPGINEVHENSSWPFVTSELEGTKAGQDLPLSTSESGDS